MFAKIQDQWISVANEAVEALIDTILHIGVSLINDKNYSLSIKWHRRAYNLLHKVGADRLSDKGHNLRLSVIQTFIRCLLHSDTSDDMREADELISHVEAELGDKTYILHWRLEILQMSAEGNADTSSQASILRRMIMIMERSEDVFQLIMQHIRHLFRKNGQVGCALMDELILTKLLQFQKPQWIGKALLRRIWMATQEDTENETTVVSTLLSTIRDEAGLLNGDICGAIHAVSTLAHMFDLRLTALAAMEENTVIIWSR